MSPADCIYPQSHRTRGTINQEIRAIASSRHRCSSLYLDTRESHNDHGPGFISYEGRDHHQGLARTPKMSDGSIYFFLSHSETDPGDQGNLMQFRYTGPTQADHAVTTTPLTVARMTQLLQTTEQHPCDLVFLSEINDLDGGYLFVVEQETHQLAVYHWTPFQPFVLHGVIPQNTFEQGPNHVFLDRIGDRYVLGVARAGDDVQVVKVYSAKADELFRDCLPGRLDVATFRPIPGRSVFPFPVSKTASQVHLIRDRTERWFLLAFRADPDDSQNGEDFVDIHHITFPPEFSISPALSSVHVFFNPGDTGFANTGTLYVEESGRLLLSSSYRWSEDDGPGDSSYVSRVDECPSG